MMITKICILCGSLFSSEILDYVASVYFPYKNEFASIDISTYVNGVPKQSYIPSGKVQREGGHNQQIDDCVYENVSYTYLLFCKGINNFTSDFVSGNFDGLDMSNT